MLLDSKKSKTTTTKLKVVSLNNPYLTYSEPEHWFMYTSGILVPVLEIPLQTTCSLALSYGVVSLKGAVQCITVLGQTRRKMTVKFVLYSKVWENWDWETKLRLMKYYVRAHPEYSKNPYTQQTHTQKKKMYKMWSKLHCMHNDVYSWE